MDRAAIRLLMRLQNRKNFTGLTVFPYEYDNSSLLHDVINALNKVSCPMWSYHSRRLSELFAEAGLQHPTIPIPWYNLNDLS